MVGNQRNPHQQKAAQKMQEIKCAAHNSSRKPRVQATLLMRCNKEHKKERQRVRKK